MCCSCCCPPAVTALFYLWVRSGFSKGSVAGALTFFPPDPPLYRFERVDKNGEVLEDEADDDEDEDTQENAQEEGAADGKEGGNADRSDDSEAEEAQRRQARQREAAAQDPLAAMTARAKALRRRARHRARVDAADAAAGVTYRFLPDVAALGPSPAFSGAVRAVKVGPHRGSSGGYVAALLYRLPAGECGPGTKTLLYSHGNATDVGAMAALQCLIAKGCRCHVLVYDYSGYGESGGVPMEKNTYRDLTLVYDWTVRHVAEREGNVVLYGQSVGSGPSCYLAARRERVGGLVLHSPFTSGMRVLTPSRALACLDIFPNIDRIRRVHCPVFIIHGRRDADVPFEHGLALQGAVPEGCRREPWWVPEKGHNDIVDGPGIVEYIQRLNGYLRSLDD